MTPSSQTTQEFPVISSDILKAEDRAQIAAALAHFKSGYQARLTANVAGFAMDMLDPRGRVIILKWKGVDVALLYQRTITKIALLPNEREKITPLKDPSDAWVLVNLLSIRYDHELGAVRERLAHVMTENARLQSLQQAQTHELEQKGNALDKLVTQVEELERDNQMYRTAVSQLQRTGKAVVTKYKTTTRYVQVKPKRVAAKKLVVKAATKSTKKPVKKKKKK